MPAAPPIARGTPTALALGPGYLRIGPLDAIEPTGLDALTDTWESFDPRWILLGYTETGSEFNYALATGEVAVAEELDPVFISTTGRTASVVFNMAELTASHLSIAMNGGIITDTGTGPVIVEPPDLGTERRYMFGFEAEDHSERWIYRQCFQSGTLKIARAKGNTVATIATTFSLEKPATGKRLFAAIMDRSKRGGWMVTGAVLAPTLTSINPVTGLAAGGTNVTLTGTNLTGATAVTFGAVPATNLQVNNATTVLCDAPAGTGTVGVSVTTPAGTATLPAAYTYT